MKHRLKFRAVQCCCLMLFMFVAGRSAWALSAFEERLSSGLPDAPSVMAANASGTSKAGAEAPLELQDHPRVTVVQVPVNMVQDGLHILISPVYLRWHDAKWLVPMAGATAATLATDTRTMTEVVSRNSSFNQTSVDVSNGLVGGMIAAPVALFGFGIARRDERSREAGLLGSEAMADAYIVDQVVKLCAFRERPLVDNGQGEFYIGSSGIDSSFISAHSMVAWSSAAVIAGEYRSKWVQLGVYAAAAGVSATRVMGQQHFPSDVLLGAAGGWLIGHYVFRAHHHLPLEHRTK
ncbi:MAG TPA: phosphatase PAP2 family protein [Acidobacteriaceae bacterium]|nr:phosphatase PAP2 family protein [Acidobacteriaceae bacterium]